MTNSIAAHADWSADGDGLPAPQAVPCPGNAFVTRVRLVDGRVDKAWSTGRMIRNMDVLLRGEPDERGRPGFVHQAHCLCNDGHALAAIRAVEDLAGVVLPRSAVLVRRVVKSLRCVQEHLLHFYQFHLSNWASLDAALRADPEKAAGLASLPGKDAAHFRAVQDRLRALPKGGQDSSMAGQCDGASGYHGPDELHLLLHGHALQAIRAGGSLQAALKLLDCDSKGFRAYRIGGLPDDLDLSAANLDRLRSTLGECREFIDTVFPGDLARLARVYAPWTELGRGDVFLTWDGADSCGLLTPGDNGGPWKKSQPDAAAIMEEREPGWNREDLHRYRLITGRDEPSFRWGDGAYFWLPAPRHGNAACEVGPLARVMGGLLDGQSEMERGVSAILDDCGLTLSAMNSTMGRVLSRGIESVLQLKSVWGWLDELESVLTGESFREADFSLPVSGIGVGRVEVPRGTLTHTVRWAQGRIVNHDYLIPSLWNFSPRDTRGVRGPLERALVGTPVPNPSHPVEILRTLHELDPCNVCHVVIEDLDTGRITLATS